MNEPTGYILSARPLKYFFGILTGTWIVSIDWVNKCIQQKTKVDELPFAILGDQVARGAPTDGRRTAHSKRNKLLHGLQVMFHSDFEHTTKSRELKVGLEWLVTWGGGTVAPSGAAVLAAKETESTATTIPRLLLAYGMCVGARLIWHVCVCVCV